MGERYKGNTGFAVYIGREQQRNKDMGQRKSIPKKMRFEVFKRDKFTCQYCGRSAPDVTLEVDHIKPVAKGGKNELLNLITSCMDCNRGKGKTELSDDSAIKKQEKQLKELADRKEQLEMMVAWREGLKSLEDEQVEMVNDLFKANTDWSISEQGKRTVRKWLKEFGISEVLDAVSIALNSYYDDTETGWDKAFNKVSGICFNRRKQANDPTDYWCNYLVKIARTNFTYCDDRRLRLYLRNMLGCEDDFDTARGIVVKSYNWSDMCNNLEDNFGGMV